MNLVDIGNRGRETLAREIGRKRVGERPPMDAPLAKVLVDPREPEALDERVGKLDQAAALVGLE